VKEVIKHFAYPKKEKNCDARNAQQSVAETHFVDVVDNVCPHFHESVSLDVFTNAQQVFDLASHDD